MFMTWAQVVLTVWHNFLHQIRAPIVFIVVLALIGFCAYILIDENVFGTITAFKFTLVIVGALGTQMLLAAAIRAWPTMFIMFCGCFFLSSLAAHVLNAGAFQDAAFENMMLGIAGSSVALLMYLLERLKAPPKTNGMTLEQAVARIHELEGEN